MRGLVIAAIAFFGAASGAQGQAVKSTVTASNGVEVTVYSDEFANRYEYSAPGAKVEGGQLAVATVKKSGTVQPLSLTGFMVYSGEWRRYTSALFKGGDTAKFTSTGRDVGRCSSSRYSRPSCTLTEQFVIEVTPAEIRAHDEGGIVAIQVRADDTSTIIFNVPVAEFKAVAEVAGVSIDPPAPAIVPTPKPAPPAAKQQPRRPIPAAKRRK